MTLEYTVNGKAVVFRERLRAGDNWDLMDIMAQMAGSEGSAVKREPAIALLSRLIEVWEFPGEPDDPAAYLDLDLFDLLALIAILGKYVGARTGNLGN